MAKRYELNDMQWDRIGNLLPGKVGDCGRTEVDNRNFVNGVLWVLRSGARWSDLPDRYGKWKTVHKHFTRWAKSGAWEKVFDSSPPCGYHDLVAQNVGLSLGGTNTEANTFGKVIANNGSGATSLVKDGSSTWVEAIYSNCLTTTHFMNYSPAMTTKTPIAYSYIRFSTPEQALGDSERRQIEKAEQWAKAKKLKLDRTHTDRGKSGFKGTNRKKGSLGIFLESISKGTIPHGSYLIVEDLDRLSREHPIDSIGLVRQIVSAGVTIVVLKNGEEYSEEALRADRSGMKMLGLVFELGRASGESARKSDLGIQNWQEKRKKAEKDGIIMTGIAPAWLSTKGTKAQREFVIIPQRAAIVRDIYEWHLQGKGARAIAKILNDEKVPNWGRGKRKATHWHQSYIMKILANPAVIGEYRPHKFETVPDPENPNERTQIRVPAGEVWKDYYPPIVDLEVYQRVQALANARGKRGVTGGRTSNEISNLFPSLIYGLLPDPSIKKPASDEPSQPATLSIPCFYKSKGSNGEGKYLIAETDAVNKPRRKRDEIKAERWPYLPVEFAVLKTLEEVDWSAVAGEGRTPEQAALAESAARLDAKAQELEEQCRNIGKVIAKTPLPTLVTQLTELEEKRKTAIEEVAAARKKLTELELARGGLIKPLSIEEAAHDPKQRDIRLALRAELARRIEMIQLTPKKLVAKEHRYRTAQVHAFHIVIHFVNGITRSIRISLNKGAEPTISAVAFQPSKKLELLPTKTTDYELAS